MDHGLGSLQADNSRGSDKQAQRQLRRLLSRVDGLGLESVKPWSRWGKPDIPAVKSKVLRQTGMFLHLQNNTAELKGEL